MDDPVAPFELGRMFFGEHPPLYYAEIVVRTVTTVIACSIGTSS